MNEERILSVLSILSLMLFVYFCIQNILQAEWLKAGIFALLILMAAMQVKRSAATWRKR